MSDFIDQEFGELSPEQELRLFLEACRQEYLEDTHNPLSAFEAIAFIAAYWWREESEPSDGEVSVPWWAIEVLAAGFNILRQAAADGRTTTLGESFNLEGGGQGKPPKIKQHLRRQRDRLTALNIAFHVHHGSTVEKAIDAVAEHARLQPKSLWSIWSEYGVQALRTIANHLTRKTSRSGGSDAQS